MPGMFTRAECVYMVFVYGYCGAAAEYPRTWIGRNGPVLWPALSPDLTPWDCLKSRIYSDQTNETRTTMTEQLARSPPTKAIRVQSPAGSLRISACGNSAGRCRRSASFLGDTPFHHTLSFWRCSILTLITLIGSQDFDVKSRPNLFTNSLTHLNNVVHGIFARCTGGKVLGRGDWLSAASEVGVCSSHGTSRERRRSEITGTTMITFTTSWRRLGVIGREISRRPARGCASPECNDGGKRVIPEKTHRPTASSCTIPTCGNPPEDEAFRDDRLVETCKIGVIIWGHIKLQRRVPSQNVCDGGTILNVARPAQLCAKYMNASQLRALVTYCLVRKGVNSHLCGSQRANDVCFSAYISVKFSLMPNNNANFAYPYLLALAPDEQSRLRRRGEI
ncbi:hypothetical protein PR048_025662 [Dryococelus australis]|uniref:Uncharacterized protein n=1 Tax=Dryococelus australis TaxID=614101 RepID=A0ABQ9GJ17_9NEOP|nr:hypothetical protein PR048_025662 [Dryococelus australis]